VLVLEATAVGRLSPVSSLWLRRARLWRRTRFSVAESRAGLRLGAHNQLNE
jgi:hypothetical protein